MRRARDARWRTVALAALTVLTLSLLAPGASSLGEDDGPSCCRGRCCCSGAQPSDTSCVRAACPCGRESQPPALSVADGGEALLPAVVSAVKPRPASCSPLDSAPPPRAGVAAVLEPPPWPLPYRAAFL